MSVWTMRRPQIAAIVTLVCCAGLAGLSGAADSARRVISLDGTWQIEEGTMNARPEKFEHTVPVPGLADLATPAFESPGATVSLTDRVKPWLRPADPRREAFWYRRTFCVDGAVPAVAQLKVNKARYGTKVLLNGQEIGEHGPCFTPGWFDVQRQLKGNGAENELIIRVGASLSALPEYLNDGWDNEKSRYIPGIFDRVELILCGTPHVVNVQTVPNLEAKSVRAVVELASAGPAPAATHIKATVREAATQRVAAEVSLEVPTPEAGAVKPFEVTVPIPNAEFWTPEHPFLYTLDIDTGADLSRTRFAMRTFTTDPKTGRALLNGQVYYLRGSNVCIYRFFEDAERGQLPWDPQWVRKLHQRFKEMHWNSLRYCIGFPPELWYEIADEEGIMIQDEFPIWYSAAKDGWPAAITADHLAVEYREWMRERWNHPCVVIWDAQNETSNDKVIAAAMQQVRDLDLSRRPWDNGWGAVQRPGDISESHPYRSSNPAFRLRGFAKEKGIPDNGPRRNAGPPYLINEYGWLWINRDGSLPTLTVDVYKRILGADASIEARRLYYARTLAAKTEFWRLRRQCCGVLHFCGLGYSRHDGQTSDHFLNVQELKFEPNFFKYVRDSFAPVGIGIDYWEDRISKDSTVNVPVRVINDLGVEWTGEVVLRVRRGNDVLFEQKRKVTAAPRELASAEFEVKFPGEDCSLLLDAELQGSDGVTIHSLRDVRVQEVPKNLAAGRPAKASSDLRNELGFFPAPLAVDGSPDTRWSSEFADKQWLSVDLGSEVAVAGVSLSWEAASGRAYAIEVSPDGASWKEVWQTKNGKGGADEIRFAPVQARYVRFRGDNRATPFGFSIWEFEVYGPTAPSRTP